MLSNEIILLLVSAWFCLCVFGQAAACLVSHPGSVHPSLFPIDMIKQPASRRVVFACLYHRCLLSR